MTLVDIAGNFDVFATFKVRTHFPDFEGATSRPALTEHGPDSVQVFLPVETDRTNHVSGVFDLFATTVFKTVNPGRATTVADGVLLPADVWEETTKEYSIPFTRPDTVQVVAVVVQTAVPFEPETMYVTRRLLDTAAHDNVTVLLAIAAVTSTGVVGIGTLSTGPLGEPVIVTAELAPAVFVATTENVYVVPFARPAIVHVSVIVVHEPFPGDAVTVYDTVAPLPEGDSIH